MPLQCLGSEAHDSDVSLTRSRVIYQQDSYVANGCAEHRAWLALLKLGHPRRCGEVLATNAFATLNEMQDKVAALSPWMLRVAPLGRPSAREVRLVRLDDWT
jgi:hypothetical protein